MLPIDLPWIELVGHATAGTGRRGIFGDAWSFGGRTSQGFIGCRRIAARATVPGHVEDDGDISRIVETLATLGEIFRKTARHKLKTCDYFKKGDYSMAVTVGAKSSRDMGVSARLRA
jgi:hypothetical protein